MKFIYSIAFTIFMTLVLSSFTEVTDEEMLSQGVTEEQLQQFKNDVFQGRQGIVDFSECHASINVPNGYVFLGKEDAKKLLVDYWGNPESHLEGLLGCLVPNDVQAFYQISVTYVITYENCGYVKDDDANSIDYDELLSQIKTATDEENKTLPAEQKCTIKGWAVQPKYLAGSHVLVWAKDLSINGVETINYDMRVLGKDGLVSINAVIDPTDCNEVIEQESNIISSLTFNKGYAYSDFNPDKDHASEWTLGGLIAGGVLAKTGVLAKLGILLVKFWKLIAVAVVAALAALKKCFAKKHDTEGEL